MQFEELHTQRLILRKITPEVLNYIHTTMDDNALLEFFGTDEAGLQSQKDKFTKGMVTFNRTFINFQILDKASGKVIGNCGFHTWYPLHNRAEIGYDIIEPYRRKGLMTEAVAAVLNYGFNQMGLHRVEALTATYNEASQKIIGHFNFTLEGTLREHYNVSGIMEDSVMYSLLKNEFKS